MAEIDWKARHDDLAAAVAALAEATEVQLGKSEKHRYAVIGFDELRAAVSDPAAVLAERDARVKAEAILDAITVLREGAETLGLDSLAVAYLQGTETAARNAVDRAREGQA